MCTLKMSSKIKILRGNCVQFCRLATVPIRQLYSKAAHEKIPTNRALQHFDDYYGSVYGKRWPSLRLALLCEQKNCALLNQFSDIEVTENQMQCLGAVDIQSWFQDNQPSSIKKEKNSKRNHQPFELNREENSEMINSRFSLETFVPVSKMKYQEEIINEVDYYTFYETKNQDSVTFKAEDSLVFPSHWKVMSFPRGNITNFYPPVRDAMNLLKFCTMDASYLLPVIALNIQRGDRVADLCAGPGNKALAIMLTMQAQSVLFNDPFSHQIKAVKAVIKNYIPDFFFSTTEVKFEQIDCRQLEYHDEFDKILLDVPCTEDRRSVNDVEDNFFAGSMVKKRNELPPYLCKMLVESLKALKPGGSLVYSTCSLSPVLNDGVVHAALNELTEERKMSFVVSDMKHAFKPLCNHFEIDMSFRYGLIVLPSLMCNYGPVYFSKITRAQ